ncbi:TPA: hypothetical protein HA265_06070 [Candidatus Woesearchaeota archaeon]|nr:hypothetical protein [Candidatus Woesearchaeota archaeon]
MAKKQAKKEAAPAKEGKKECCCGKEHCGCMFLSTVVSEGAFYAALYYLLKLLEVPCAGLWWKTLILFVLINIAILFCPVLNPYLGKKFGMCQ